MVQKLRQKNKNFIILSYNIPQQQKKQTKPINTKKFADSDLTLAKVQGQYENDFYMSYWDGV